MQVSAGLFPEIVEVAAHFLGGRHAGKDAELAALRVTL
jgi:hypothetical protein